MIYLDNAATAKMKKSALEALVRCNETTFGNPSSLHEIGQKAAEVLWDARERVAACLGASAKEIIFTSGGSESDNQAILSAAQAGEKRGKKHIVSTAIEHHAVLHTLRKLEKQGFSVTLVGVGADGIVRPEDVENAITPETCLVTVMYANNEIGTLQPIAEIGKICKKRGVLFHTDAVQAVGHLPVDVKKDDVDMLSFSAHKFGGPKGVGALYVKKGVPVFPLIEGGAQERGLRAGTENVPAIVATAVALEESVKNLQANTEREIFLRDKLIRGLAEIPHSALNGHPNKRLSGNVSFCFEGIEGESVLLLLSDKGVCASSGSACTSGSLDPSHVLLAIGRVHDVAHGSLRLTLSEETTEEEIDYTVRAVMETVDTLRRMSPVWRELTEGKRKFII